MRESIQIRLQKEYAEFDLSVDLALPATGITALFGVSGSGKTTLLRCIAGLEKAESATIRFGQHCWQDEKQWLPTAERRLGYVFQEPSLFPHLTVADNLAFGQKKKDVQAIHTEAKRLGIEHLLHRFPSFLSGGERQRVAIARTLLSRPSILLMDEPLAALDFQRKQEILPYLKQLKAELQIPVIYVSHSIDEVVQLADYLVVLKQGRVCTEGVMTDVYHSAGFTTCSGAHHGLLFTAKVMEHCERRQLSRLQADDISLWVPQCSCAIGAEVRCRIDGANVQLSKDAATSITLNSWPMTIVSINSSSTTGVDCLLLRHAALELPVLLAHALVDENHLQPGQLISAQIPSVQIIQE